MGVAPLRENIPKQDAPDQHLKRVVEGDDIV
jgi:hypothetical protein